MKIKILLLCSICLLISLSFAGINPTIKEEISSTFQTIDKLIEQGKENILHVYTAALEIQKRATTQYQAQVIAKKIISTSRISSADFEQLRKNYNFAEISIIWAVSQTGKIPLMKLLDELKNSSIEKIMDRYGLECEYMISEIGKLNPQK
ncbi:MAG: hypothetical protein ACP5JO_06350 [Candidatus Ratteibacteria bacterium]